MKKITPLFLCVLFLGVSVNSYGQFNKLKDKAKDKGKDKQEKIKSGDTNSQSSSKQDSESGSSTFDFDELQSQKMEWTSTFERLEKQWDKLTYDEYTQKKDEYSDFYKKFSKAYKINNKKQHDDAYTQKLLTTIDEYYTETVPDDVMEALENKVKRSFDNEDWSIYPTDRIKDIENAEKEVTELKAYLKTDDPELTDFEKSLADQKAKIKTYVDDGGLEKRNAEVEKRQVEKRHLHEAGMTDESVNQVVFSEIDKGKYGTPQKVVITSRSWQTEENNYGQIKLKFVKVDIATKKDDGKCYYVKGSVAQKHLGGGKYDNKYLNIYYTEGEMNCDNINN
jgi:hypothetical protein